MAFSIYQDVQWKAGEGTDPKYRFILSATVEVVAFVNHIATITLRGTATVIDHPMSSRNSFAASDYAVLVPGNVDVSGQHPFVAGENYYQRALPFLPDPQNGDASKMLIQFRGDTWASDPTNNLNRVSLWTARDGLVLDKFDQESNNQFVIDQTFTLPINTDGDTVILAWDSSGANSSTAYNWLDRQVWASWFDLDYRPGATLHSSNKYGTAENGVWRSNNRSGGACHVFNGTDWEELRTIGGGTLKDNPPLMLDADNGTWYDQRRIGKM